ncbi:MAG: TOBE domain-containing protein, partial [Desulfohalobiaceae bacterium]|nr:TOBE domain-containing protein [Desulfohalobiaceae bacterium]
MSDRIGILLEGRLKQFATPKEVYFRPDSYEVARFLGPVNIIPRDLYPLFGVNGQGTDTDQVLARPENLTLEPCENGPGRIVDMSFAGHYIAYEVSLGDRIYTVYTQKDSFNPGQPVSLKLVE